MELHPTFEETARLFEKGLTAQEIASARCLKLVTIDTHLRALRHAGRLPPLPEHEYAFEECARMFEQGMTTAEIATERGCLVNAVQRYLSEARKHGRLPPALNHTTARDAWEYLYTKRAVPCAGYVTDVLRALPPDYAHSLAAMLDRSDESLADLLARIVRSQVDEPDARR